MPLRSAIRITFYSRVQYSIKRCNINNTPLPFYAYLNFFYKRYITLHVLLYLILYSSLYGQCRFKNLHYNVPCSYHWNYSSLDYIVKCCFKMPLRSAIRITYLSRVQYSIKRCNINNTPLPFYEFLNSFYERYITLHVLLYLILYSSLYLGI